MPFPSENHIHTKEEFKVYEVLGQSEPLVSQLYHLNEHDYKNTKLSWSRRYFDSLLKRGFALTIFAPDNQQKPIACMLVAKPLNVRRTRSGAPSTQSIHGKDNFVIYSVTVAPEYKQQERIYVQLIIAVAKKLKTMTLSGADTQKLCITLHADMPELATTLNKFGFISNNISGRNVATVQLKTFMNLMQHVEMVTVYKGPIPIATPKLSTELVAPTAAQPKDSVAAEAPQISPLPYSYTHNGAEFTVCKSRTNSAVDANNLYNLRTSVYKPFSKFYWKRNYFDNVLRQGIALEIHTHSKPSLPVAFILLSKPINARTAHLHGKDNLVIYSITVAPEYQHQGHIITQLLVAVALHCKVPSPSLVDSNRKLSLTLQRTMQPALAVIVDNLGFNISNVNGKEICAINSAEFIAKMQQQSMLDELSEKLSNLNVAAASSPAQLIDPTEHPLKTSEYLQPQLEPLLHKYRSKKVDTELPVKNPEAKRTSESNGCILS